MSTISMVGRPVLALVLGGLLLAACSPRDMETTPVKVETAKGTVVCQLYTHDLVYWDRSIQRPDGMSADQADGVCAAKGRELLEAHKAGMAG